MERVTLIRARMGLATLVFLGSTLAAPGAGHSEAFVEPRVTASDGAEDEHFGHAVAVDGDVLAAAALYADSSSAPASGAVYVYLRDETTGAWVERKKLARSSGASYERFGASVAVAGDLIAVGAPNASVGGVAGQGAVHIYARNAGGTDNWGEIVELTDASLGTLGWFGAAVAFEDDLLAVGASRPYENGGRVVLFERSRGGQNAWGTVTTILDSDVGGPGAGGDGSTRAAFGAAVAFDGDQLLVGASGADVSHYDQNDGAAYLFVRDTGDRDRWTYLSRLVSHEAALCFGGRFLSELAQESPEVQAEVERCAREDSSSEYDGFGGAVALGNGMAVVAARAADTSADNRNTGAVYVFTPSAEDSGGWRETAKLTASEPQVSSSFGNAIALAGGDLLVGAEGATIGAKTYQGALYHFAQDDSGAWEEIAKLLATDGFSSDRFGSAVAAGEETWFIGARGREDYRGAVYMNGPRTEPPPPPSACNPAVTPTAELHDSAIVQGPSGVRLGAVQGALSETLSVWMVEVPPPAEPLFSGATPVGAYFNIGAECTVYVAQETPFVVALPVPGGTDTTNLAAALLVPASSIIDGPATGAFWQPLTGSYDAASNLYLVALTALPAEGATAVLVNDPELQPLELAGTPQPAAAAGGVGARGAGANAVLYFVRCVGFTSSQPVCDDLVATRFQIALLQAHLDYQAQGFPISSASYFKLTFLPDEELFKTLRVPYKLVNLMPDSDILCRSTAGGHTGDGKIDTTSQAMTLCLGAQGIVSDQWLHYVVRHSLFHLIQLTYYPALKISFSQTVAGIMPYDDWVIEGTADAAVESSATMQRTDGDGVNRRDLRQVDVRLTFEQDNVTSHALETQDFWVYLLANNRHSFGLGELDSFFERGASTTAVADRLVNPPTVFYGTLGQEYWSWVKNQVMEKAVTLQSMPPPGTVLANPCQLEHQLLGRQATDPADISWPTLDHVYGGLERLQAELVKVEFTEEARAVTVLAEGGGGPSQISYKVYLEGEEACDDPTVVPDSSPRTFLSLPAGTIVYVVLASTEPAGVLPPLYRVLVRLLG